MIDAPAVADGDDRFTKLVTRLRPSQLGAGEVATSNNGRMDESGTWKLREGYKNVSGVVLSTTNAAILADADSNGALTLIAQTAITTAASTGALCILSVPSHGLSLSHTHTVYVTGLTFTGTDPNGLREVTTSGVNTLTYPLADNEVYGTGSAFVESFRLESAVIGIYGACKFSDPDNSNDEYIIIADNTQATAIKVSDLTKTTIAYPSGETIGADCDLQQEFDTVVLRQDGATSWEWDGDLSGSPAFTKLASGTKTQHSIYDTPGNTDIANGVATVTETAHGRSVGDVVRFVSSDAFDFPEGQEVVIATVPGANSFTYYVDAADVTGANIVYSTRASLGGGYINAPAAPWGVYHQRRAWVPYTYDAEASPSATGRTDEIIASDSLDNETFDPVGSQFRITAGTADFIVGAHPFDDDRLLVFNRNSIHYLKGVSGSLSDVQTIELTREIGCTARKSIVTYANNVLFLSDSGVYSVSFLDEYNLRGTDLPLSEAIEPTIKRINQDYADKAVAVYHDNRYWIAVPLDDSTVNNTVLVYNFLNAGWESIDTTNASNWGITELIPARSGKVNELYAVTTLGGVHKLDGTGAEKDDIANSVGESASTLYAIPGVFRSRQYTMGTLDRKKFNQAEVHLLSDNNFISNGDVSVIVEDPDATVDVGTLNEIVGFGASNGLAAGQSASLRRRVGNRRGYGAQVEFSVTDGRPEVRAVGVKGTLEFGSVTSVE